MNILAVDDEHFALELMRSALEEVAGGSTVYLCRDVRSAIQTAKDTRIDVAFLDIHMPEMSGIERARELKRLNPKVNIVFATGFSEYMKEGIDLRMSGYVMKPVTPAAIRTELENLRNPIEWSPEKRIKILTFGNFDVFAKEEALQFKRSKTKELFAFLVDRNGAGVTAKQICAVLFPEDTDDSKNVVYLRQLVLDLKNTLKLVGAESVLSHETPYYRINPDLLKCDYFSYLEMGKPEFHGEYMTQYSWAEETCAMLQFKK